MSSSGTCLILTSVLSKICLRTNLNDSRLIQWFLSRLWSRIKSFIESYDGKLLIPWLWTINDRFHMDAFQQYISDILNAPPTTAIGCARSRRKNERLLPGSCHWYLNLEYIFSAQSRHTFYQRRDAFSSFFFYVAPGRDVSRRYGFSALQRIGRMTARLLWWSYLPDALLGWKPRIFPRLGTTLKNRDIWKTHILQEFAS